MYRKASVWETSAICHSTMNVPVNHGLVDQQYKVYRNATAKVLLLITIVTQNTEVFPGVVFPYMVISQRELCVTW